ncbi:MAG: MBL fold metallo-hydrolase, partial [Phycisphaerae bacterium]|nr:MBL fold metallo-hydrolase [Phycisphaerae bacterium]
MKRGSLTTVLTLLCLAARLEAQQDPPKITLIPVAGPVYMLQGGGAGNIGVVADPAGMFMIDAMEEATAGPIREAIRSLPGGDRVRILVNTHWHGDHVDGNKAFGPVPTIIAHENVRALLAKDQVLFAQVLALPPAALPNVVYSDRLVTYAGGEMIRLVHCPHAHTNGDTLVFIDSPKVVHMGDLFFNGMFPFLDMDHGGDIDNWVRQLDAILAGLPADSRIIPG